MRLAPAIAIMAKKKHRIERVSPSKGMAWNNACISTFRPLTLEIVLRGLMTLNALRPLILKDPESDGASVSSKYVG